jgi:hypothetical protein
MNNQFIFKLDNKLESDELSILEKEDNNNLLMSSTINLPLISLGFHSFIHRTKSALTLTDKLQTKNKFYMIVNPYEIEIQNHEDSLHKLIKEYLDSKEDKEELNTPEFYELWEILFLFGLGEKKELVSGIFSNKYDTYTSSLEYFRDKFVTGHKTKNYNFSSKDYNFDTDKTNKNTANVVDKNTATVVDKNTANVVAEDSTIMEGGAPKKYKYKKDVEKQTKKLKTEDLDKIKDKLDLIIATTFQSSETGFLYTEQENYKYILSMLINALQSQENKGSMILRIDETFTTPSVKLLYIINHFYESVHIYKPSYSKYTNANKYLVCNGFRNNNKKILKSLENVLSNINKYSNKFVYDIYPDLTDKMPQDYVNKIKFINIKLTNREQIMINDIIVYIKNNNYFGDDYHKYRNNQIQSTKWWITNYLPPSKNLYEESKKELAKSIVQNTEMYLMEFSIMHNILN